MEPIDPYRVLEVPLHATRKEVESAYHRLVSRRPPHAGVERRLIEDAYLILADPARRAAHDRSRGLRLHPAFEAEASGKARLLCERGRRAIASGQWELAYKAFHRAVALHPWVAEHRSSLGLAMAELGLDAHRARELCLEALRLEPSNSVCREHLAAVYEKFGFRKRALRVLHHSGR